MCIQPSLCDYLSIECLIMLKRTKSCWGFGNHNELIRYPYLFIEVGRYDTDLLNLIVALILV